MNWCFGLVNNKLAEIYFEKNKGIIKFVGHALVKKSEYASKSEKLWIAKDTAKVKLNFKDGEYVSL